MEVVEKLKNSDKAAKTVYMAIVIMLVAIVIVAVVAAWNCVSKVTVNGKNKYTVASNIIEKNKPRIQLDYNGVTMTIVNIPSEIKFDNDNKTLELENYDESTYIQYKILKDDKEILDSGLIEPNKKIELNAFKVFAESGEYRFDIYIYKGIDEPLDSTSSSIVNIEIKK